MEIRIYYEDTDCGGVVYYANYLKYFERARTHYLEARGVSVAELMHQGTTFVVVHTELEYKAPARYGETLIIDTVVSDVSPASFTCTHVVRDAVRGGVIVKGSARLAVTDRSGKIKRLDQAVVAVLESGSTGSEGKE